MFKSLRKRARRVQRRHQADRRIATHLRSVRPNDELKVVLGGHWAAHEGWLVLSEEEQDITRRLAFPDSSVNVLFLEHVIEHVPFAGGVHFFKEAMRVLKSGGVLRLVFPAMEKLLAARFDSGRDAEYFRNVRHFWAEQDRIFEELGIDGLGEYPNIFFLNSMFTDYGHKFIWSADLMAKVLSSVGFHSAKVYNVGEGSRTDICIERRRRGIYMGKDPSVDLAPGYIHDVESLVVEAIK